MALAQRTNLVPLPMKQQPAITVALRQQYGQQVIHPVDETAKLFAELIGTKTLTRDKIETIKRLGYKVEVQQDLPKEL